MFCFSFSGVFLLFLGFFGFFLGLFWITTSHVLGDFLAASAASGSFELAKDGRPRAKQSEKQKATGRTTGANPQLPPKMPEITPKKCKNQLNFHNYPKKMLENQLISCLETNENEEKPTDFHRTKNRKHRRRPATVADSVATYTSAAATEGNRMCRECFGRLGPSYWSGFLKRKTKKSAIKLYMEVY